LFQPVKESTEVGEGIPGGLVRPALGFVVASALTADTVTGMLSGHPLSRSTPCAPGACCG
jgi:hypothetical protein